MSSPHVNNTIVGYSLELKTGANAQEFEEFMASQVANRPLAVYRLSKDAGSETAYLWTAQIGEQSGGVSRAGHPLVLHQVLDVISALSKAFPVEITYAFWSPFHTASGLIGEFNKLPGLMKNFDSTAVTAVPSPD